ncbi:P-loop ATPase, Sll1717 family [Marinisporobacter balticus]|uniref:Uncharacterized protein n=1 Tax=Marinisporobacter balticus TaxID=2018667 RepID=A0A4R2KCW1_9FIRM|nr:hypothetical protein [Marinisporobacter balticus]TCO68056.1 hypothetical protein EV214_1506 [Marinisporobacter balticus]
MSFSNFYNKLGFDEYPFRIFTSESEKDKRERLFIKLKDYSLLQSSFDSKNSIIINGDRGTGKTIILNELYKESCKENNIVAFIDDFASIGEKENILDYYKLIIKTISDKIIIYLFEHKKQLRKLKKEDKIFLSFLIQRYADNYTENQLRETIESIQLGVFKKIVNTVSRPLTSLLNYGATAATNFGSEFLNKSFGEYLPRVNMEEIQSIFPDIKFLVESNFNDINMSYELLNKMLEFSKRIGINKVTIIFDKLDEDERLENDAQEITSFFKNLFIGNKLLLNDNIQLIISVWKIPFDMLKSKFRKQKHFVYNINWNFSDLEKVLSNRMKVFSNNKIEDYKNIFENTIDDTTYKNIFKLSNNNPRDLWHILDKIIVAQYDIDSNALRISEQAIATGLEQFVEDFDFYEYYPRRKNARKNTNDVYSYIEHLRKLNNSEFTRSELENFASTGGSTQNYITNMVNIGIVKKTAKKRDGSVIYKIVDPKIEYAIKNNFEVSA